MRKLLFPLFLIFLTTACKKHADIDVPAVGGWYEIEIKTMGNAYCSPPEIAFLTGQKEAYALLGDSRGTYIPLSLPKVLYAAGTKLLVQIRKPVAGDVIPCTTGIPWARVFIIEVR